MICNKNICTGCGVCYSVCPVKCITMEYDEEGFIFPTVNEELCIGCNKCKKNCHAINNIENNNYDRPITIGCWNKDKKILKKSSSGGAFSAISDEFLNQNGVVIGSVMDGKLDVFHLMTDNLEGIEKMHGSKYIQSETRNIYYDAKKVLDSGKKVLFTGCPCQIAGLYTYLQGEKYDNLMTIDLVCHGVGSRKIFDKYIEELNDKYKEKVIGISFRSKHNGWRKYTTKISFNKRKPVYIKSIKDSYMSCYLQWSIYRKSCYACKYAKIPRIGDITIGDFVGINRAEIDKKDYKKGVSVILLNNKKAEEYFNKIQSKINWVERPLEEATTTNSNIVKPSKMPSCREYILKEESSVKKLRNKYCKLKLKTRIGIFLGDDIVSLLKSIKKRG